jgi:hypothetical protein
VSPEPAWVARITILAAPPSLLIETDSGTGRFPLPGLHHPALVDLKARLPQLLHGFRVAVGIRGVALGALAQRALDELDDWAAGLAGRLLGGLFDQVSDITQFETDVARLLYPALNRGGDEIPVIEVVSGPGLGEEATWLLPIEFLRVAEPGRARRRPDDVLRRVLGFHAVIVRRRREPTGPATLGKGPIPVSALIYNRLEGSNDVEGPEQQAVFFQQNSSRFHMRRWPRGASFTVDPLSDTRWSVYVEREVASGLAGEVLAAAGLDSAEPAPYHGAIVHVACHYHTEQAPQITQPVPFLTFDQLHTNVGVDALWNAFSQCTNANASVRGAAKERFGRMIVFLNACETASSAQNEFSLLENLFLLGFRHVVASETLVPDPLAAAFATQLYLGMMRGLPLGGALLQARKDLLERYDNPGGLLYTLYGDPWLRFNTL